MPPLRDFTRRGFIAGSSAAAGAAIGVPVWAQSTSQAAGRSAEFVVPPPKVITGATRPLLAGNTARPLRYRPVDGDFVIRNGGDFFNRPLYGPNINFYVDAGDLPEFSLFLHGHGGVAPTCLFVSQWRQDQPEVEIPLAGRAEGVYLLITGITFPQASRMEHGSITVVYTDGVKAQLPLKSLETWWLIEQDYVLDDYLFIDEAPLPPRVDLLTGTTRLLDPAGFKGNGRSVPGGAATILFLPLDPRKRLASLKVEANLYGIAVALLAATLARPF